LPAGIVDPTYTRRWLPIFRWLARVFHRPTITGLEHLPPRGEPYMLVANHSAGIAQAEIICFAVLYLDHTDRAPLAAYAHSIGFRIPLFCDLLRRLGAIPSTYEAAHETLASGVPLLVFPGGDYETLRPIWQVNRVDFGGRKGFLRIAREKKIPIVPMGIRGSHFTAPILLRSRALAYLLVLPRLLGLKRWGISLLGVVIAVVLYVSVPWSLPCRLALIYAWLASPFMFLSWIPATIRYRIGPALAPAPGREEEETLEAAYDRVQRAVQNLVDRG